MNTKRLSVSEWDLYNTIIVDVCERHLFLGDPKAVYKRFICTQVLIMPLKYTFCMRGRKATIVAVSGRPDCACWEGERTAPTGREKVAEPRFTLPPCPALYTGVDSRHL